MAHLETFSTVGLPPRRKLEFWNEFVCASFTPNTSEPVDVRTFIGHIDRTTVGDLSVAEVYSDAQAVLHTRSHVARARRSMFFIHMQLEGESVSRQDGREARLGPGDFTLCDTTRAYEILFNGSNRMFVVGIPENLLRRHITCPESVVAVPMSGNSGLSGLLSHFLRDFWLRCREDL